MELVLGTVQFGLRYGIAGPGSLVPHEQAKAIVRRAFELGIHVLDTAAAYGDIEQRLLELTDGLPFRVVSKLPPKPPVVGGAAAARWAEQQVRQAEQRLGPLLEALLFHRAEDLLESGGETLWQAASDRCDELGVKTLGVSVYDPQTLELVSRRFPVALAQAPGSALDQRFAEHSARCRLHLRSAFLQGLLLMPETAAVAKLPAAAASLRRWHAWCEERELSALEAALGIAKSFANVSHCIVGVDRLDQLESISAAWQRAQPLLASELATTDVAVIDPRCWKAAA